MAGPLKRAYRPPVAVDRTPYALAQACRVWSGNADPIPAQASTTGHVGGIVMCGLDPIRHMPPAPCRGHRNQVAQPTQTVDNYAERMPPCYPCHRRKALRFPRSLLRLGGRRHVFHPPLIRCNSRVVAHAGPDDFLIGIPVRRHAYRMDWDSTKSRALPRRHDSKPPTGL